MKMAVALAVLAAVGYGDWKLAIPEHRVAIRSELVMLGDLDGDHRWTENDLEILNGLIDEEDASILRALVAARGDPYAAEAATGPGHAFPRPRELYRYISTREYRPRPSWTLPYRAAESSILRWLAEVEPSNGGPYGTALDVAIRNEAIRFDRAYRRRERGLIPIEREYVARKLARLEALHREGRRYELLLALMDLVEDAETLAAPREPDFGLKLLTFRDHLRSTLVSPEFEAFTAGREDWRELLRVVSDHLKADLGLAYDFEKLGPPRNLGHLENYLQRTEWQYYKTSVQESDFIELVAYAQHDSRYLRAVAKTTRKLQDPGVENHNLPMVLLFREALRIEGGDKKKAVGMLDEAIRIPYAWIKSIPREALPGSLALDNFLLPGNKEDGADKSRHWNVFGGICLYKSPQEALDLALKREMQDLRDDHYSVDAMRELFRDLIADVNGMYHVMAVDPGLLRR